MLFLNISSLSTFSCFISLFYITTVTSIILYVLPTLGENHFTETSSFKAKTNFFFIKGSSFAPLVAQLSVLALVLVSFTYFYENAIWMGHLTITPFSKKMVFVILLIFNLYLSTFLSTTTFSSRESYDFLIVNFNTVLWLYVLFMTNSIISTFFIIEVLSALLFLMLVSSAFSSLSYYNNLDFNNHHYLSNALPITYLKSIIFFFWVSLLASLNLFIFTLLLYTKLFSFDWYLLEHVFFFITCSSSYEHTSIFGVIWYVLLFSIFTKCGLAPFFFWKPTFFKGLTLNSIFFYICMFYFSIFLFLVNFISGSFFFIFMYYYNIFIILVVLGLGAVMFLLLEAFYIKTFLAVSSILNSLMIFLSMASPHVLNLTFFL